MNREQAKSTERRLGLAKTGYEFDRGVWDLPSLGSFGKTGRAAPFPRARDEVGVKEIPLSPFLCLTRIRVYEDAAPERSF